MEEGVAAASFAAASAGATPSDVAVRLGVRFDFEVSFVASLTAVGSEAAVAAASVEGSKGFAEFLSAGSADLVVSAASVSIAGFAGASSFCRYRQVAEVGETLSHYRYG